MWANIIFPNRTSLFELHILWKDWIQNHWLYYLSVVSICIECIAVTIHSLCLQRILQKRNVGLVVDGFLQENDVDPASVPTTTQFLFVYVISYHYSDTKWLLHTVIPKADRRRRHQCFSMNWWWTSLFAPWGLIAHEIGARIHGMCFGSSSSPSRFGRSWLKRSSEWGSVARFLLASWRSARLIVLIAPLWSFAVSNWPLRSNQAAKRPRGRPCPALRDVNRTAAEAERVFLQSSWTLHSA